jgi:hypothetical protein
MFVIPIPLKVVGFILWYLFCRFMPIPTPVGMLMFIGGILLILRARHRRQIATQEQQAEILAAALTKAEQHRVFR